MHSCINNHTSTAKNEGTKIFSYSVPSTTVKLDYGKNFSGTVSKSQRTHWRRITAYQQLIVLYEQYLLLQSRYDHLSLRRSSKFCSYLNSSDADRRQATNTIKNLLDQKTINLHRSKFPRTHPETHIRD